MTIYPLNSEIQAAEDEYIRCLNEMHKLNQNRQASEGERSAAFNRLMEAKRKLAAVKGDTL